MHGKEWWKSSVIYEIVVPSFQDSNGDGWGDLRGILQRLDYICDLGVDAIWLTPIFCSPMHDLGYDVSDYLCIDPRFGTLEDFDQLLLAAHERHVRVILDFVPNHTSVEHPWFQASRSSRDNPHRDWYIWSDAGPHGKPPCNWVNRFGANAWTWNARTKQYFLGTFSPQQPDLNWRNQQMREAIFTAMRYWLQRGVDGLRMDALAHLIKDEKLRDNPANPDSDGMPGNRLSLIYHQNLPELLTFIRQISDVIHSYDERLFIGEVYQTAEQITAYQLAGADLLLTTSLLQTSFDAVHLRNMIDLLEARTARNSWPSRSSGNHDIGRVANRVGEVSLRQAALLHLAVRGTPTIYYGEELGLSAVDVPLDRIQDPSGRDDPQFGRDGCRAPMAWSHARHGGFSSVEPWLPQDQAVLDKNVASQLTDRKSLLMFYRRLLAFRKGHIELQHGDYRPVDLPAPLVGFIRGDSERGLLLVLNISDCEQEVDLRPYFDESIYGEQVFSTIDDRDTFISQSFTLAAREGIIARLREALK